MNVNPLENAPLTLLTKKDGEFTRGERRLWEEQQVQPVQSVPPPVEVGHSFKWLINKNRIYRKMCGK